MISFIDTFLKKNNKSDVERIIEEEASMSTVKFKKISDHYLVPYFKKYGFNGSGFIFFSVKKPYIFIIELIPHALGKKCYMQLGVAIENFPDITGRVITDQYSLRAGSCEFGKVLCDRHENLFIYGENENKAQQTIQIIEETFSKKGEKYFKQFKNFSDPILAIKIENLDKNTKKMEALGVVSPIRLLLLQARVNAFLHFDEKASEIANFALKNISLNGRGSNLRKEFKKILEGRIF